MRLVKSASLTEIFVRSEARLMNEVAGASTAVIGQIIDGYSFSTSVKILKFCVYVFVLARMTYMSTSGAGVVTNFAYEHGSIIVIVKVLGAALVPSTCAESVMLLTEWLFGYAFCIITLPPLIEVTDVLVKLVLGVRVNVT